MSALGEIIVRNERSIKQREQISARFAPNTRGRFRPSPDMIHYCIDLFDNIFDYTRTVYECSECNMRYKWTIFINTEHNMKSIGRAAVAQWTKRLTRNGQTRVRIWKGANILLSHEYTVLVYPYTYSMYCTLNTFY